MDEFFQADLALVMEHSNHLVPAPDEQDIPHGIDGGYLSHTSDDADALAVLVEVPHSHRLIEAAAEEDCLLAILAYMHGQAGHAIAVTDQFSVNVFRLEGDGRGEGWRAGIGFCCFFPLPSKNKNVGINFFAGESEG